MTIFAGSIWMAIFGVHFFDHFWGHFCDHFWGPVLLPFLGVHFDGKFLVSIFVIIFGGLLGWKIFDVHFCDHFWGPSL